MSKFNVGDEVFCPLFGGGIVIGIKTNSDYPVKVEFSKDNHEDYTLDGRLWTRYRPTLTVTKRAVVVPPKDTLVRLDNGALRYSTGEMDADMEGWLRVYSDGRTSFTTEGKCFPAQSWEVVDMETLK